MLCRKDNLVVIDFSFEGKSNSSINTVMSAGKEAFIGYSFDVCGIGRSAAFITHNTAAM